MISGGAGIKKLTFFFAIVLFLAGCTNEEETEREKKEKYDNAINQVVTLENKRLQHEKELSAHDVLLREKLGVVVYSDGHYVRLYYNIDSQDWPRTEKTYERYAKNTYRLASEEELKKEKNQKYFEVTSYRERVPTK